MAAKGLHSLAMLGSGGVLQEARVSWLLESLCPSNFGNHKKLTAIGMKDAKPCEVVY